MNASQSSMRNRHEGVVLGLGEPGKARDDLAAEYNVVHWVYVPPEAKAQPREGDFHIWSWGEEYRFKNDVLREYGFVPVYALYLS